MKAQVSTELLIIVGLVLILFIPILITIYMKASETNERLTSFQSTVAQARLVHSINSIGHLGQDAYILAEVYLPPGVQSVTFTSAGLGNNQPNGGLQPFFGGAFEVFPNPQLVGGAGGSDLGGEVLFNVTAGVQYYEMAEAVQFPLAYVGDPILNPSPGIYRFKIFNSGGKVTVERQV